MPRQLINISAKLHLLSTQSPPTPSPEKQAIKSPPNTPATLMNIVRTSYSSSLLPTIRVRGYVMGPLSMPAQLWQAMLGIATPERQEMALS